MTNQEIIQAAYKQGKKDGVDELLHGAVFQNERVEKESFNQQKIQKAIDVLNTEFGTCTEYMLGCPDCIATRLKQDLEEIKKLV